MLSFPVDFVSSARESDRNRMNMAKRGCDFAIEDLNSDTETDREEPAEKVGRKYDGAAKYHLKYNPSLAKEYPVKAVDNDRYSFFCIPCGKSVSCHHQGLRDVKVHCERDTHRRRLEDEKKSHSIQRFLSKPWNSGSNVIKAEVMITNLEQHNLPMAHFHDDVMKRAEMTVNMSISQTRSLSNNLDIGRYSWGIFKGKKS